MAIEQYDNISSIIDNYDAFLVDLWGVIHDGTHAYPGVNQCLKKMKAANKEVIFLSNAPRRAFRAVEGLQRVGVPEGLYDHVVTSGEVTYEYMRDNSSNFGQNYYMIGPERDAGLLDGLDYTRVSAPSNADFAIVTGFENDDSKLEEKIPELQECLKHKLFMICANPDIVVVRQTGIRALCAGVIAQEYDKMGGKTQQFGKPYPQVYQKCFSYIDEFMHNTSKARIAAIGDNLDTDIKGANNANLDSYLVAGGILGEKLAIKHGQLPAIDKLQNLCTTPDITPKAVLPAFIW